MLSEKAQKIFNMKYASRKGETWEQAVWRVSNYVASVEENDEWVKKFYQLIYNLVFLPGGRILANAGTEIKNLNNCISGETRVLTESGWIEARNLNGRNIKILSDGGVFRESMWASYGKQFLYKVTLKNGDILFATKDHEWLVSLHENGKKFERVKTLELSNRMIPFEGIENFSYTDQEFNTGVKRGLVFGDGTLYLKGKYSMLTQFKDSMEIIPRFFSEYTEIKYNDEIALRVNKLPSEYKTEIPDRSFSRSFIRGFIAGLVAADGCVDSRGHIMLHNSSYETLLEIRNLCSYAGIPTNSITLVRKINPFNGEPSTLFKLSFVKRFMYNKHMILLEKHREKLFKSPKTTKRQTIKVVSVEKTDRYEDVFCCVEPKTHTMVIDNCYLTGQCFVLPMGDSRKEIYQSLNDAAEIFAWGGGVGYNFSDVREEGSDIKTTGGKASGPLSFMSLFDQTGEVIQQASRRGAQIGLLDIDHPDIEKFINYKSTPNSRNQRLLEEYKRNLLYNGLDKKGTKYFQVLEKTLQDDQLSHFNISVVLTDKFMEAVKKNEDWNLISRTDGSVTKTLNARDLLKQISKMAWESGDPGVFFFDRSNEDNMVPHLGSLRATNPCGEIPLLAYEPCVAEGEKIFTNQGLSNIEDVYPGMKVLSKTNFGNWVYTTVLNNIYRGEKDVYKLILNTGLNIKVTDNHKILTDGGWKKLSEIKVNDNISILDTNSMNREKSSTKPSIFDMFGWMTGDGWFVDNSCGLVFGYDDSTIMNILVELFRKFCGVDYKLSTLSKEGYRDRYQISSYKKDVLEKFKRFGFKSSVALNKKVPEFILYGASPNEKLDFLRGLFSADGSVGQNGIHKYTKIKLASSSKILLEQVQLLLLEFGIQSNINWCHPQSRENAQGVLDITGKSALLYLDMVGFLLDYKTEKFEPPSKIYSNKEFAKVISIEKCGIERVYDLVLDSVHNFIANGIVVHNCCLGSLNLHKFYNPYDNSVNLEFLEFAVRTSIRFLDNVQSLSFTPVDKVNEWSKGLRRLGLGVMGLADLLVELGIPYGSQKAIDLSEYLSWFISYFAWLESFDLAKERGAFPFYDKNSVDFSMVEKILNDKKARFKFDLEFLKEQGVRNVSVTSIAPTGSIALLAGVNSGIEPFFALAYKRNITQGIGNSAKDYIIELNPLLEKKIENSEEIKEVVLKTGSLQDTDLSTDLKYLFKNSHEIFWNEHIDMQAAWQKYISNAVSKTINCPNNFTEEDIYNVFLYGWENGLKGLTVYRDKSKSFQVLNVGVK